LVCSVLEIHIIYIYVKPVENNYIPIHTNFKFTLNLKNLIPLLLVSMTLTVSNTSAQSAKPYPTYPGGTEAMTKFLHSNIRYPKPAFEKGEEGQVKATFIVEYDGKVSNVLIWEGLSIPMNEEAARIVRSMPRWNLGYKNGKRVRGQYSVYIDFKIPQNMSASRKAITK
jgi:TonB family protein